MSDILQHNLVLCASWMQFCRSRVESCCHKWKESVISIMNRCMREEHLPHRLLCWWFVGCSAPEGPACPWAVRVAPLGVVHVLAAVLVLLPGTFALDFHLVKCESKMVLTVTAKVSYISWWSTLVLTQLACVCGWSTLQSWGRNSALLSLAMHKLLTVVLLY